MDGAEGACAETVTHKTRLIKASEWEKTRPFMLMISAKSWTQIKKDWLEGCRMAGPNCNVQVESVEKVIRALDEMAKRLLPLTK